MNRGRKCSKIVSGGHPREEGMGTWPYKNERISAGISEKARSKRVFQVEGTATTMVQRWEKSDEIVY